MTTSAHTLTRCTPKCCTHAVGTLRGQHGPFAPPTHQTGEGAFRCCHCGVLSTMAGALIAVADVGSWFDGCAPTSETSFTPGLPAAVLS